MRPHIAALLSLVLVACQTTSQPQADRPPASAPETSARALDLEHYSLQIALHPEQRSIEARVRLRMVARAEGVERVDLDLVDLEVRAVRGSALVPGRFVQNAAGVQVPLARPLAAGEALELELEYGGQPTRGLYFARQRGGRPTQVWTQGECIEVEGWLPTFHDPADRASGEIRVDMPAAWQALAAGVRLERRVSGERAFEHWRMDLPHPAYLVTLAAGEFVEVRDEWNGLPLQYLVAPDQQDLVAASYERTPEILQFFSRVTGRRYPWPKYAQVSVDNFHFGGMENISASTMSDLALVDERAARDGDMDGLVAHEAAHQWFGDLVTCEDWSQAWLNEGFATYFTALFTADSEGDQAFQLQLDDMNSSMVERSRTHPPRAMVWQAQADPIELFLTGHIYAGAALRLHLLRASIGDPAFFRGVQLYLSRHQHGSVRTSDLLDAMQEACGKDLAAFFTQWFETPGKPRIEVRWKHDPATQKLLVSIDQTQALEGGVPACFRIDTELELADEAGVRRIPVTLDARKELLELDAEKAPRWVRFDPRGFVPKELIEEWSPEALSVLARSAREAPARRKALLQLAKAQPAESQNLFLEQLGREEVASLRAIAAKALDPTLPAAREALLRAARSDEGAAVRAAALGALSRLSRDEAVHGLALEVLADPYSYGVLEAAARLLVAQDPAEAGRRLDALAAQTDATGRSRAALVPAWHSLGELDRLRRLAQDASQPVRLREACVRALSEDRALARSLIADPSFRVRRAALDALDARDADLLKARLRVPIMPEVIAVEAALQRKPKGS